MFFNSWYALLRILVVGVCAYVALVALLRVSGKRTLSKLNAFDLVVTVALGSTLATAILSKETALAEGSDVGPPAERARVFPVRDAARDAVREMEKGR